PGVPATRKGEHRQRRASGWRLQFPLHMTGPLTSVGDARRVAIASAIGTTIEWYDFFIYGTAAAVVFGPQFFPQASNVSATLAAFAAFAVAFVARPLGGVVMG